MANIAVWCLLNINSDDIGNLMFKRTNYIPVDSKGERDLSVFKRESLRRHFGHKE
jgi:hypothetical protein